jgi:hypothetical protein
MRYNIVLDPVRLRGRSDRNRKQFVTLGDLRNGIVSRYAIRSGDNRICSRISQRINGVLLLVTPMVEPDEVTLDSGVVIARPSNRAPLLASARKPTYSGLVGLGSLPSAVFSANVAAVPLFEGTSLPFGTVNPVSPDDVSRDPDDINRIPAPSPPRHQIHCRSQRQSMTSVFQDQSAAPMTSR